MQKKVIGMIILLVLGIASGCKKAPINEKIEGHWLVKTITTLDDNITTYPYRMYYSIGRTLTEVQEKQGISGLGIYIGRTEYRENETILVLKEFVVKEGTGDKGERPTRKQLEPFGLTSAEENVFDVVKSTRRQLIIESNWARIEMERF